MAELLDSGKPVDLLRTVIENSTNSGEVVLDPFAGIGAFAIACINTNRNYIGFELDEEYYRISRERLENHMKQLRFSDMWEDEKC